MAKTAVTQWDTTAANNTDVGAISIQGTAPVSNFDNAMREMMAQIATFITGATFTGTATFSAIAITTTGLAPIVLTSTDAGGAFANLELYRNSASPAANDGLYEITFYGKDSGGNKTFYGGLGFLIGSPTDGAETGQFLIRSTVSGALTNVALFQAGVIVGAPTGGDKGAGTINATGYYLNGTLVTVPAVATAAQYRANTTSLMLTTDQVWAAAAEVTLTDAATVAVDFSTFINAVVTLGGNRAMGNPTNEKVGQSGVIRIVQDGTGSRTLSYGTDWEFTGGIAPTLSTAAGANDLLFYHIIATDRVYASLVKAVV
jgi:hypothetical protein